MTTCRTSGTTWKTRTNWTDKFKIALPLAGRKKQHTWPAQHPNPSVVLFLLEVMGVKKKEAVSYAVCYVLAAVLLAFYLITLYRGLHPNTSPGYEAYYLEQELYTWPGSEGIDIQPGEKIHFDSALGESGQGAGHILRAKDVDWVEADGWSFVENTGYCITSWRALLLFAGEPGRTYQVSITLASNEAGGEVTFFVNGEQAAFSEFPGTEQTIEFETQPLPEDGRLEMEIVLGGDLATPVSVKELVFV